jgi:putative endonuclease
MHNHNVGRSGEEKALEHYIKQGYMLVAQNFQYYSKGIQGRNGEIDLIVQKNNVLVFIEVKSRTNTAFGQGLEQITRQKLHCLYKTYQYFIMKNPRFKTCMCRFDVVSILNQELTVIENAYSFEGLMR